MPTVPNSSVKPTIVVGADSRFATTFLSTKYRDKAVNGEALMDKTTGELFIKRVSDGKIVSFHQNKKMIGDMALELRLLLGDNAAFNYPKHDDNAYFVSTNYDLIAINNEVLYDLATDNVSISGEPNDINKLTFAVSGESNGFFCRNATRDMDKAFVEFITNQYNIKFKNYVGNNEAYIAEHNKFTNVNWKSSNAVLTYDLNVIKGGNEFSYPDNKGYVVLNEDTAVIFPQQIYDDHGSIDSVIVTIKSIEYDKIHFMTTHKDEFDETFISTYNKFLSNDTRVELSEFNVSYFVNDASSVNILGNEIILAFLDMPHINKFMHRMDKLVSPAIKISDTQPNVQGLWFKPKTT